jgi:hypothetical protein
VPQQERVSTTDPDATYATKGGPAARPRLGKNDCLRDVAAQSQKSRSSVCGVEEPNRPASCTTTSAEVRSRAVLPGGHRSEPATASSLPHPNTETAATHHRVSKDLARTLYFGTSQRPSDSFLTASFSTATAHLTTYPRIWIAGEMGIFRQLGKSSLIEVRVSPEFRFSEGGTSLRETFHGNFATSDDRWGTGEKSSSITRCEDGGLHTRIGRR